MVWDNHSIHRRPVLRALIEARGAVLAPQPRYSPETNACEEVVEAEAGAAPSAGGHRRSVTGGASYWRRGADGIGLGGLARHAGYVFTPIE